MFNDQCVNCEILLFKVEIMKLIKIKEFEKKNIFLKSS